MTRDLIHYISSISEHNNDEDLYGRLSMWRTFGGTTPRVAIVLCIPYYSAGADSLNIAFNPVAYLTKDLVHTEIDRVIQNIYHNAEFLRSVERSRILEIVFNMLIAGVVCLKHSGFHEECEWRVIYAPNRLPSPLIESSTEVIAGIPQLIYKLPLDGSVADTLAELDLSRICDRLIIGPSPILGRCIRLLSGRSRNAVPRMLHNGSGFPTFPFGPSRNFP